MHVDVTTDIVIQRPVDEVAAYAADPDHVPHWYVNIPSVEWKTPRPAVRFVMLTAEGPFPMETTYTWSARPDGATLMTLRNRGTPTGFSRVLAPFMARAMRRATQKDLAALKALMESGARTDR